MVTTFAGNGVTGYRNGLTDTAEFFDPLGLALDKKGNLFVADNGNNVIRQISPVIPTGIEPVYAKKLTMLVYPNPCSDKLVIASAPQGAAEMFDVMGREVWGNEHFKAPYILSTQNMLPGVYFIRVQNASGAVTQKIVIQR